MLESAGRTINLKYNDQALPRSWRVVRDEVRLCLDTDCQPNGSWNAVQISDHDYFVLYSRN